MEGVGDDEEVVMRIVVSSEPLTKFGWCVRERAHGPGGGGSLLETDSGSPRGDGASATSTPAQLQFEPTQTLN